MRVLAVICALAVAGCATAPQGRGLPLPAEPTSVAPRPGAAVPVARTYSEMLVRAFVDDEAGQRREVGGADCVLEAPSYTARFRSPGRVVVPVPPSGAPAIDVACRAGELSGSARRGVVRDRYGRYGGWGPGWWGDPFYGPWWGDPWYGPWGGRPRSGAAVGLTFGGPAWGWGPGGPWPGAGYYPNVEVTLR